MAGKIGLKSMAGFCRQAAVSFRAGLTTTRVFPLVARESRDPRLRRTLKRLSADIEAGKTLNEAVREYADRFPPIFVEMVGAGERTGHIDNVFQQLADYFDTRVKIRRAVISASIYPAIQLFMLYAVFCLIAIISSPDWAGTAETIAYYTAAALVALAVIYYFFWRTAVGKVIRDQFVLGVPVFRSVAIKLCMTRFARSLAMQIESAIPIIEALESSARVAGNVAIASSLKRMADPIRRGASLAEAVKDSRYATPIVREVLAIGEETGEFGDSLNRVADIYEEEALMVLEALPKFIGPIVLVIVAIGVIILFYKVYFGMYINPLLEAVGM